MREPSAPAEPDPELVALIRAAHKAAQGDSNDNEIEAWRALAEDACHRLGVNIDDFYSEEDAWWTTSADAPTSPS